MTAQQPRSFALLAVLALALATVLGAGAQAQTASTITAAQESSLRKSLADRLPSLPKIDEINRSAMPGLLELRVNGVEILYTDVEGSFLIQGSLIDTRTRRNLTEERVEKLTAIDFDSLPLKDAITIVRGNGKRKLAVFEDPNCGYCKRFERDLQRVDNVTIYLFLYPILGPNSTTTSQNIWCNKDRAKAFLDWMTADIAPPALSCDAAALRRNVEFGARHRITGTPTLLFTNGARVPGAVPTAQVEKLLAEAR